MQKHNKEIRPLSSQPPAWLSWFQTRKGFSLLIGAAIAFILLAVIGSFIVFQKPKWLDLGQPDLEPPLSLSELAEEYPEIASLLTDTELDSAYKDFLLAYQEGGLSVATELARQRGILTDDDMMRITLELDTEDTQPLVDQLKAQGILVSAVSGNLIDIAVPLSLIEDAIARDELHAFFADMSALEHVVRVRLPRVNVHDAGNVESESLSVVNASTWHAAGIRGDGIRIGILDLGFNDYRSLLGTDLPANVVSRSFILGKDVDETDTVHGTAVAEIIHDIAPDAELFFAAYETDVEEQQAVDWLVSQGVQIISHSAGSLYGPMDGTGEEARMVNRIVRQGILWVNSAGNYGDGHYRAKFMDQDGDGYHEFAQGDELLGFAPDPSITVVLNWDAWDSGDQDFDLYIFDKGGDEIASSENIQAGIGDDPAEYIRMRFSDPGPYFIAIYARRATREVTFDLFIHYAELEYITPEYSVTTPGDAQESLTVGATWWSDDSLEAYSSRGPTHDGRLKPDISAPAGVSSAAYGEEFTGTSASAPHVAAAAALVWQANPEFTVQQVKEFLLNRAIDLGVPGADNQFGYGRLWLGDVFVASNTQQPTPTITTSVSTPTSTSTPEKKSVSTATPTREVVTVNLSDSTSNWVWLFLGCVVFPGVMGLGSIGLLITVSIYWKSKRGLRQNQPSLPLSSPGFSAADFGEAPQFEAPAIQPADDLQACPQCGSQNRKMARFCNTCGSPLEKDVFPQKEVHFCTYCGASLRKTSKFCPRCGRSVSPIE